MVDHKAAMEMSLTDVQLLHLPSQESVRNLKVCYFERCEQLARLKVLAWNELSTPRTVYSKASEALRAALEELK